MSNFFWKAAVKNHNSSLVSSLYSLVLGIVCIVPIQTVAAQTNLKSSEVKGGVVTSDKGDNIFDPSPIQDRIKIEKQKPVQEEIKKSQPQEITKDNADLGPVRINSEEIAERASGDRSLMNALEESRKLRERLGIVGGQQKSDPKNQIEGIKKSLEKQKKLKEEQKYQF